MILITGASGLLGGHLLIELFKRGHKIRILCRKQSKFDELKKICLFYNISFDKLMAQTEKVYGDLLDTASLNRSLVGVDEVFHCAAIVSFSGSSAELLRKTNVQGTANLVNACLQNEVKKLAYSSSIGALGQSVERKPIDENTPWNPVNNSSVYSNSKYYAEQEVWRGIREGLNAVIVNPGVILGFGDFEKGSLQFFSQVKRGMPFYTDSTTGYVDVRDVCRTMILLMERDIFGERFVLVSDNLSNRDLFSLIAKAMNKQKPFIRAGKVLLSIAYYIGILMSKFTGKPPLLTKEIIRSALKKETYSSEKIKNKIGFKFIEMEDCIKDAVKG